MATVCVPCHDKGKPNVPATRFVPIKKHGSVPMCEACWGGGIGPGMNWTPPGKAVQQDVAPKPPAPAPKPPAPDVQSLISQHRAKPGRLSEIADSGKDISMERKKPELSLQERKVKMQADRDADVPVKQIAEKYGVSTALVYMETSSPSQKKKEAAVTRILKKSPAAPAASEPGTIKVLRKEIDSLKEERVLIDEKIEAIERVIEILNQ